MKRRLVWLLALAGLVWLYLRRGARRPEPVVDVPPGEDPAEDLRRKLDETRERTGDAAAETASGLEEQADQAESAVQTATDDLDAKRREVHDRARAATDEMHGSTSD